MPLWAIILAVAATMFTLTALAWAACKVGGDADDWERETRRQNAQDARFADAMRVDAPSVDS